MNILPLIFLLIGSVAECLQLYRVDVPHYKRHGESAELQCQFQLGRDRLYAVKWYKDNEEFFRYVPRFNPSIHTHPVDGVHVDILRSTAEVVVLKSVVVRSTGVYKCEVSAEAPSFASFMGVGRMTVVYLPKEGPQISGTLRDEYEVGDTLDLNCTSSKSFPPARISWYINDIPVMGHPEPAYYDNSLELPSLPSSTYSSSHTHSKTPSATGGHQMIRSTTRRLLLSLTPEHFAGRGTAKVRCVARIFPLFWQDGDEKHIDYKNSNKNHHNNNSRNPSSNSANNNQITHSVHNNDNEVDAELHQQFHHERAGSLYKGEALVQIRGGCSSRGDSSATAFLLSVLFSIILTIK